jgi:hypothetical protein
MSESLRGMIPDGDLRDSGDMSNALSGFSVAPSNQAP